MCNEQSVVKRKRDTRPHHPRFGEDTGKAKHTNEEIRNVCKLLADPKYQGYSFKQLEAMTGVSQYIISSVSRRTSWNTVSDEFEFVERKAGKGVNNHRAKYTESQINDVCMLLSDGSNISYAEISDLTGVSYEAVFAIHTRKRWKHISKNYNMRPYVNNTIRYTEDQIRHVCEMLSDPKYKDLTMAEVAHACGVEPHTVTHLYEGSIWTRISNGYELIHRHQGPRCKYTAEQAEQICQMLDDMYHGKIQSSTQKIADAVGVNPGFVNRIRYGDAWKEISSKYDFKKEKEEAV